ncbi:cytochrome B [Roseobacter sp. HKCCA0434]|uniref:cytochrome B n=1 Tax=Roseobacter sp. HKCCA0434 TaxID=3079297 RepID=UPI002905E04F|nr:cytochrome B [Roseobacter sp. HKCCA0434]
MKPGNLIPRRRTALKLMHFIVLPLAVWFTLVQPRDVTAWGPGFVRLHSVFGLIFVTAALIWSADYFRRGLIGRPGPKLGPRLKVVHRVLHHALVWGLFLVAVSGFFIGLTASRQLWAGDIVPIAVPLGMPEANRIVGTIHSIEFYLLAALIAAHAAFHIWRHVVLGDNALRIVAPKFLHRFL